MHENIKQEWDEAKEVINLRYRQKAIELGVNKPKYNFKEFNIRDMKDPVEYEENRHGTRKKRVSVK